MAEYKVIRIIEPDFGCEGLPDGEELMDTLVLEDNVGDTVTIKAEDKKLYELDVCENDIVTLDDRKNIASVKKQSE